MYVPEGTIGKYEAVRVQVKNTKRTSCLIIKKPDASKLRAIAGVLCKFIKKCFAWLAHFHNLKSKVTLQCFVVQLLNMTLPLPSSSVRGIFSQWHLFIRRRES